MRPTTTNMYALAKERLNGRLFAPYQREGVMWMLTMEQQVKGPKGGFLCDEMGLGKTVQLVATMLGNPKPKTLIVVPKSIVHQWCSEIEKFAPQLRVFVFDGPDRPDSCDPMRDYDVVVSPYTLLTTRDTTLHTMAWDRVILDEAHEIRNRQSKTFVSIKGLHTKIRWIVTGTPVFNSIADFIALCDFLGFSKSVVQGMSNKIKDIYVLRRTKEDLSAINERLRLPPCYFENVELEMFPEEKKLYEFVFTECKETVKEIIKMGSTNSKTMEILECLLRARQTMIWPQLYIDGIAKKNNEVAEKWVGRSKKMETLFHMLSEHPKEKAIIFCQFMGEMDYIVSHITTPCFRIDGSVPKERRIEEIDSFKKGPPGSVFVIQIKAGGQGLNLQEATRVYITSPAWNPATELQAIARSHRTGQVHPVHVKKLIYAGSEETPSVEEAMISLQGHKSIICAEVLNDERVKKQIPVKKSITIHDVRKIFLGVR